MLTRPAGGLNEYFFFVSYGPIWTSPLTKFTHFITYIYFTLLTPVPATYKNLYNIKTKLIINMKVQKFENLQMFKHPETIEQNLLHRF